MGIMHIESDGHRIPISSPRKCLFPDADLTKLDLVRYYVRVAPLLLPHLRRHLLTLQRFPEGVARAGFFQKNAPEGMPHWIRHERVPKEGGTVDHVVADDAATLAYLANIGTITLHASLSAIDDVKRPDRLVFDLDPASHDQDATSDAPFPGRMRLAARELRGALNAFDLPSYLQTTGSRGLHVVVPIRTTVSFDESRQFALALARQLAAAFPDDLTTEQRIAKRGGRIFLDYLRNAYGQTAVAPYSVRALPDAPVATPLDWAELGRAELGPRRYTMRNIFRRLGQKACPWQDMSEAAIDLRPALKRLAATATDK